MDRVTDLNLVQEGFLLWVELDRPESKNAISLNMAHGLARVLRIADQDPSVRVVLIKGSGGSFCAGGDLKAMRDEKEMFAGEPEELRFRYETGIQEIPKSILRFEKPLIAVVEGAAIGAGLDLACMCDIRIATAESKFGETFVKLGLVSGDGGSWFLQRIVGLGKALELSLTGQVIDGLEAHKIGLVQRLAIGSEILQEAKSLAEKISQNGPTAVRLVKKSLYHAQRSDPWDHLERAAAYQAIAQRTEDHRQGVEAMLQKQRPKFEGYTYGAQGSVRDLLLP